MPFGLGMPSFPSLKKWQLLMMVLTACIVAFMVLSSLSAILGTGTTGTTTTTVETQLDYGLTSNNTYVSCFENFNLPSTLTYIKNGVNWGTVDTLYGHTIENITGLGNYSTKAFYAQNLTGETISRYFNSSRLTSFPEYNGTSDQVLGLWFMPSSYTTLQYVTADLKWIDLTNGHWIAIQLGYSDASHWQLSYGYHGTDGATHNSAGISLTDNYWYWIELRHHWESGSTLTWFINGTAQAYGGTDDVTLSGSNQLVEIGLVGASGVSYKYGFWQATYIRLADKEEFPPNYPTTTTTTTTTYPIDILTSAMVLLGIGLVGAMMDVVAPVYIVETFMDGDYIEAMGFGFLMLLLGTAFIIAWLW